MPTEISVETVWRKRASTVNQRYHLDKNKVIRPKSRALALAEKSGRQTDEQTKTFKKTFELATKSLKNIFVTNKWTDRQMDRWTDGRMDGQTDKKIFFRSV